MRYRRVRGRVNAAAPLLGFLVLDVPSGLSSSCHHNDLASGYVLLYSTPQANFKPALTTNASNQKGYWFATYIKNADNKLPA